MICGKRGALLIVAGFSTIIPQALAAQHPKAPLSVSGIASAIGATLTINGKTASLPTIDIASGKAPPVFSHTHTRPSLTKSYKFKGVLKVSMRGHNLTDTVTATGFAGGPSQVMTSTSIGDFSVRLSSSAGSLMTISGLRATSGARLAISKAGVSSTAGAPTWFENLIVSAPALGIENLVVSGMVSANQILFQNADKSLTIYLGAQMPTGVNGAASGLTVEAIDVHFDNFTGVGGTVSGDIAVGINSVD